MSAVHEKCRYYFNKQSGFYYDPSTGLYCSASSSTWYVCQPLRLVLQWYVTKRGGVAILPGAEGVVLPSLFPHRYKYNEETGAYDEAPQVQSQAESDSGKAGEK